MKHTLAVTLMLVVLFILSQVLGLGLIARDAQVEKTASGIVVYHPDTAMGGRPETKGSGSLIYVLVAILVGTLLVLLLAKYKKISIWRIWFFLAVWMAVAISLGVVVKTSVLFTYDVALVIGAVLALLKMRWFNPYVHNVTEVLMYAGIALLIVPLFDVFWAFMLLIAISIYDAYAVWKSKHMVAMAKFQTESRLFAGLFVEYHPAGVKGGGARMPDPMTAKRTRGGKQSSRSRIPLHGAPVSDKKSAILGGGDMAFPLIFSGVALEWLITQGVSKSAAFLYSNIITLFAAATLLGLFFYAKKDHFYPAMPFLSAGCFLGFLVMWLIV
jgi:presenilin-like A22 family membrane protease